LTGCTTLTPEPAGKDAERVFAPVQAALACPAPPFSLTTPAPVPPPPKGTAGSYRALPGYVADLLGWIADDRDRSKRREAWHRERCGR
jgi:hypothetical protein